VCPLLIPSPPEDKEMLREDCRVGMVVEFGRENGEWTKGEIVKMNPMKAKVKTLEQRGNGRGSQVGTEWGVPYSMMRPLIGTQEVLDFLKSAPQIPCPYGEDHPSGDCHHLKTDTPIPYNRFQDHAEQCILEAIVATYSQLSPENLTCDGELPRHVVMANYSKLNARLQSLFKAYGRSVSESVAYKWMEDYNTNKKAV